MRKFKYLGDNYYNITNGKVYDVLAMFDGGTYYDLILIGDNGEEDIFFSSKKGIGGFVDVTDIIRSEAIDDILK